MKHHLQTTLEQETDVAVLSQIFLEFFVQLREREEPYGQYTFFYTRFGERYLDRIVYPVKEAPPIPLFMAALQHHVALNIIRTQIESYRFAKYLMGQKINKRVGRHLVAVSDDLRDVQAVGLEACLGIKQHSRRLQRRQCESLARYIRNNKVIMSPMPNEDQLPAIDWADEFSHWLEKTAAAKAH